MEADQREILVRNWLRKAKTSLGSAIVLRDAGDHDGAMSRLYYSAFYAVTAILTRDDKRFKSHAAVKACFTRDYVKTGLFAPEYGRLLTHLLSERQDADYRPDPQFAREDIDEYHAKVRVFLDVAQEYLKTP